MFLLYSLYFVYPALVLARAVFGPRPSRWDAVGAIPLAFLVVGWFGYAIALVTIVGFHHHTFALANLAAYVVARRKGYRPLELLRGWRDGGWPRAESWLAAVVAALAFAAGLVLYQTDLFSNSCLHQALSAAVRVPLGHLEGDMAGPELFRNWLLKIDPGEREGVYAALAPFAFLFGFLGLRIFYAVTLAGAAVYGYLAARAALPGSRLARISVAVLFAAFPPCIDVLWNDGNTVGFLAASALLWLVLRGGVAPASLGVFCGLLIAIKHEAVLCLLAPLLAARREREPRAWFQFGRALAVVLIPMFLRHAAVFGTPFGYEGFAEYDAHPHRFLGVDFELHGMLNFPLYPQVVRTPFNPLPLFLWFPIWSAARVGLVTCALIVIGLVATLRAPRRVAAAGVWVVPYAAMLAVNENWMQVEKMGIMAPLVPPLLLAAGRGVEALLDRRDWPLVLAGVAVFALGFLGLQTVSRVRVPYDPRFYVQYPWMLREDESYLTVERRLATPRAWPSPEWAMLPPMDEPLGALAHAVAHPSYAERVPSPREQVMAAVMPDVFRYFLSQREHGPLPETRAGADRRIALEVSLARPWMEGLRWLGARDAGAPGDDVVIDLYAGGELQTYRKFPLPWQPTFTASLSAFRRGADVFVVLSGPNPYERSIDLATFTPPPYEPMTAVERPAPPGDRVVLVVPVDARLHFIEITSLDPSRIYRWYLPSPETPGALDGPIHWRHD